MKKSITKENVEEILLSSKWERGGIEFPNADTKEKRGGITYLDEEYSREEQYIIIEYFESLGIKKAAFCFQCSSGESSARLLVSVQLPGDYENILLPKINNFTNQSGQEVQVSDSKSRTAPGLSR